MQGLQSVKRTERGQHIAARKQVLFKPERKQVLFAKRKSISATRAKTLTPEQIERVLTSVRSGPHAERDTVLVFLSFACGLRAQEIAGIRWHRNVLDAEGKIGENLHVTSDIGKRTEERLIPIHPGLRVALKRLRMRRPDDAYVIHALADPYTNSHRGKALRRGQCDPNTLVQYLRRLYKDCGFVGCTSHSGRRTFITSLARRCNEAGASIRDVQLLAGHKSLETTAAYIEPSNRQHELVGMAI